MTWFCRLTRMSAYNSPMSMSYYKKNRGKGTLRYWRLRPSALLRGVSYAAVSYSPRFTECFETLPARVVDARLCAHTHFMECFSVLNAFRRFTHTCLSLLNALRHCQRVLCFQSITCVWVVGARLRVTHTCFSLLNAWK